MAGLVGFEFEFASERDPDELLKSLWDVFGPDVAWGMSPGPGDPISLGVDTTADDADGAGYEIRTPPLPPEEAFDLARRIARWVREEPDTWTHDRTGVHVTVDADDEALLSGLLLLRDFRERLPGPSETRSEWVRRGLWDEFVDCVVRIVTADDTDPLVPEDAFRECMDTLMVKYAPAHRRRRGVWELRWYGGEGWEHPGAIENIVAGVRSVLRRARIAYRYGVRAVEAAARAALRRAGVSSPKLFVPGWAAGETMKRRIRTADPCDVVRWWAVHGGTSGMVDDGTVDDVADTFARCGRLAEILADMDERIADDDEVAERFSAVFAALIRRGAVDAAESVLRALHDADRVPEIVEAWRSVADHEASAEPELVAVVKGDPRILGRLPTSLTGRIVGRIAREGTYRPGIGRGLAALVDETLVKRHSEDVARAAELVMRKGTPSDIEALVDRLGVHAPHLLPAENVFDVIRELIDNPDLSDYRLRTIVDMAATDPRRADELGRHVAAHVAVDRQDRAAMAALIVRLLSPRHPLRARLYDLPGAPDSAYYAGMSLHDTAVEEAVIRAVRSMVRDRPDLALFLSVMANRPSLGGFDSHDVVRLLHNRDLSFDLFEEFVRRLPAYDGANPWTNVFLGTPVVWYLLRRAATEPLGAVHFDRAIGAVFSRLAKTPSGRRLVRHAMHMLPERYREAAAVRVLSDVGPKIRGTLAEWLP